VAPEASHFGTKIEKDFGRAIRGQVFAVELSWLRADEHTVANYINVRHEINVLDHRSQLDVDIGSDLLGRGSSGSC
jgi:hypothetical protein